MRSPCSRPDGWTIRMTTVSSSIASNVENLPFTAQFLVPFYFFYQSSDFKRVFHVPSMSSLIYSKNFSLTGLTAHH